MSASILSVDPALFRGTLKRMFVLPALLGAFTVGLLAWQITGLLNAMGWLEHSVQVMSAMERAEHNFSDEAAAVRDAAITQEPSFRGTFGRLAADADEQMSSLRHLVSDNPEQMRRLDAIDHLHRQWAAESRRWIASGPAGRLDTRWTSQVDSLRLQWQQTIALEDSLRAQRVARVNVHTRYIFSLLALVCLLFGGLTYAFARRHLHQVTRSYSTIWKHARSSVRRLEENHQKTAIAQQVFDLNASLARTNQQLLQRERELREAQRLAELGSWELDLQTKRFTWSEELFHLFGLAQDERVPDLEDHRRMFTEESWEILRRHIDFAAAEGVPYALELDMVRADGAARKIFTKGEVERDATGVIVRLRGTAQDITERKALEERLSFQANHDALTGLPNRQLLMQKLEEAICAAAVSDLLTGLLYLDVDNFKFINDTLGHANGDLFLAQIAERISSCVRGGDTVARIGGDEFVVICSRLSSETELEAIAGRIISEVHKPLHAGGSEAFISLSAGLAVGPRDGETTCDLLKNADLAMYQAKQFSRDTYMFYSPEMVQRVHSRVETEKDLRHALERGEFLLHYQPRIDLLTGQITGLESLIRWQHPCNGLVLPGHFIEVAEVSGLIVPIGEWALDAACLQVQSWSLRGLLEGPVAVNVSIAQLKRKTFVQTVESALRRHGLNGSSIEIEITESLLLEDASLFAKQIGALKELGVLIAIDDFGTRYSNLNYLKKIPIDTLKIDQSFVRDIDRSPSDAAICRSIIALAQNLNLRTVGEGVERFSELAYLRQFGCNDMQGFLLARPQPPELIAPLLGQRFSLLPNALGEPASV